MFGLFDFLKVGMGAVGALLVCYYVVMPIERRAGVVEGHEMGIKAERVIWEDKMRLVEAQQRRLQQAAQVEIDAFERQYLEREETRAKKITALEEALEEEKNNVASVAGAPCTCRPGVSRGVRDALQPIGRRTRAPARADSAKPDPSVRRSR